MRVTQVVFLVGMVAACGDPSAPGPQPGQATLLVYNPSVEIAHVTARPGVGSDFRAVTLGDVPAVGSVCFVVAAGPAILLEARVGSLNVRSNTIRLMPDGRYVWTVGDPNIELGGPCEP